MSTGSEIVRVTHADGIEGAASASGVVVVIDVLRAFTVTAFAFAGGATRAILVRTVEEATAAHAEIPGSVIAGEVGGRPIPGVPVSNSPTQVSSLDLAGRTLIQRTSAGTQCVAAAQRATAIYPASLVVATATCRVLAAAGVEKVTMVASGGGAGHVEDHACAHFMEAVLRGAKPDLDALLAPLYGSERYRWLKEGREPGFPPSDLELALKPDRFDFALRVTSRHGSRAMVEPVRGGA